MGAGMKNIKKSLLLAGVLILAISLVACKGKETSSEVKSKETPAKNTDVKNTDSVESGGFTYSIIDETYTEEGITIKFPQLNKTNNEVKADSVNKVIQESIRTKLASLRMGQKDMGAFTLDLKYEMADYGKKVLSISYQGYSHFEKAAYPVDIYHTQNITLNDVNTLALKDIFIIDDHFVEAFKSGIYSPSRDDLDLEKSGVNLKETIERQYANKDLINLFQKNEVNFKLTMYGVIVSIEVPHAIGDHLEMAIPYEAVEVNMIKSIPVWKDYLFIKSNNETKPIEIKAVEISMDIDVQKKLDTFFSNFSEANVKPFEKGKIDDSSLIGFGVIHVIINNDKLISYKGEKNEGYIKAEDVDTMTSYYFGEKVSKHKTVDSYIFENGSYKFQMASGEAYTFSQIEKLSDLGNNKYQAEVSIYKASSGFTGDSHGTINDWKASGEEVPKLSNKVTATIEKINENGKEHYILIEYKQN